MPKLLIFLLSIFFLTDSFAQLNRDNTGTAILTDFTYAFQMPGRDMSDRFGLNFSVGGGVDLMTKKQNFIFGIRANFLFGNEVKEDVLSLIRNEDGLIFGDVGFPAEIDLRQRGLIIGAHFGKLFSIPEFNERSGIRATFGLGLLQHKVRIQDDPTVFVSQLTDTYKKGYDRLSNGLALTQFIGYQHLGKNRLINFFAGFEFTQAFTQSRRDFDFDTFSRDEKKRLDILFGFKIGWILPFYVGQNPDELFY